MNWHRAKVGTVLCLALAALAGLPACRSATGSAPLSTATVVVSAASSLSDVFVALADDYERSHAGVDVVVNFGGSATLREQVLEGAPVDVFAPADAINMRAVVEAGRVDGATKVFAANVVEVAVPVGNPGGVRSIGDLATDDLFVGLCAPQVPCGHAARLLLTERGVHAAVDTNEPNVRALLAKIEAGEVDAGIVYATDIVSAAGRVVGLGPITDGPTVEYPIAVLDTATDAEAARLFVEFVLSEPGARILADHGFLGP